MVAFLIRLQPGWLSPPLGQKSTCPERSLVPKPSARVKVSASVWMTSTNKASLLSNLTALACPSKLGSAGSKPEIRPRPLARTPVYISSL